MTNKYIKAIIIVLVLALFFFPTIIVLKYIAFKEIYFHYVNTIEGITGLNTFLIKAIFAILMVPFVLGLRYIFSFNKTRRTIGTIIIIVYVVLYNFSLYQLTKNQNFNFADGEVMKWYALTPDGVKYFDKPGVEPIYGIKLQIVTPEIIKNLKLVESGVHKVVDPETTPFFNPITGEAKVWYLKHPNGIYEFYDKPGYHPGTGQSLMPVSHKVVAAWETFKEEQAEIIEQKKIAAKRRAALIKEEERKERELAQQKEEELKKLINPSTIIQGKTNIGLVVTSNTKNPDFQQWPESNLANNLKNLSGSLHVINNFFSSDFSNNEYFTNVFNGDNQLLPKIGVFKHIDYVILGYIRYSFIKKGVMEGIISCPINFTFKVIDKHNSVVNSGSLSVTGPGYSEQEALKRGIEMLTENYFTTIFQNINTH